MWRSGLCVLSGVCNQMPRAMCGSCMVSSVTEEFGVSVQMLVYIRELFTEPATFHTRGTVIQVLWKSALGAPLQEQPGGHH